MGLEAMLSMEGRGNIYILNVNESLIQMVC